MVVGCQFVSSGLSNGEESGHEKPNSKCVSLRSESDEALEEQNVFHAPRSPAAWNVTVWTICPGSCLY